MATTVVNRVTYFNIGGGRKQCSSLYGNINGTRKTISSAYGNVSGSRKQIYPYSATTVYTYTWNRYSLAQSVEYVLGDYTTYTASSPYKVYTSKLYLYTGSSYRIDEDKKYHLDGGSYERLDYGDYINAGKYFYFHYTSISNINNAGNIGLGTDSFFYAVSTVLVESHSGAGENTILSGGTVRKYTTLAKESTVYSMGSYIDQVTSSSSSTYPYNGRSGSYWYVYQGQS